MTQILEEKHIPFPGIITLLSEKVHEENHWEINVGLMEVFGNQFIADKACLLWT